MKALYLILSIVMVIGCGTKKRIGTVLERSQDSLNLRCIVSDAEEHTINDSIYTFLYGVLEITNTKADSAVINISRIKLRSDQHMGNIYFDSVASVLISEDFISAKSKKEYKVYWAFDGTLSEDDLKRLTIDFQ